MKALRSKTINFALLLGIAGYLELNVHMVKDLLGDWYGLTYIIIGIIVAALRVVTTKPIREK